MVNFTFTRVSQWFPEGFTIPDAVSVPAEITNSVKGSEDVSSSKAHQQLPQLLNAYKMRPD